MMVQGIQIQTQHPRRKYIDQPTANGGLNVIDGYGTILWGIRICLYTVWVKLTQRPYRHVAFSELILLLWRIYAPAITRRSWYLSCWQIMPPRYFESRASASPRLLLVSVISGMMKKFKRAKYCYIRVDYSPTHFFFPTSAPQVCRSNYSAILVCCLTHCHDRKNVKETSLKRIDKKSTRLYTLWDRWCKQPLHIIATMLMQSYVNRY